jgi:tRNA (guanine37-N1)-methyltransferase
MRFDILTIFPHIFDSYFGESILKRAQESGRIEIAVHNIRDWATDKHKTTDDIPYGGGAGMVMKIQPIFDALNALKQQETSNKEQVRTDDNLRPTTNDKQPATHNNQNDKGPDSSSVVGRRSSVRTILFSAKGKEFTQRDAERLAKCDRLIMICGRYEGVDERVAEHLIDEEFSIGEYVLTGGEIPAMIVVDSVSRLLPGVLGNEESLREESFSLGDRLQVTGDRAGDRVQGTGGRAGDRVQGTGYSGGNAELGKESERVLDPTSKFQLPTSEFREYPHYTRPEEFNGWKVPEVLLSGNHKEIEKWRNANRLQVTGYGGQWGKGTGDIDCSEKSQTSLGHGR